MASEDHTSEDLWAHACVPSLIFDSFLSSVFHLISRDAANFKMQLNFSKDCIPIPEFSADHQEKTEIRLTNGNELGFPTKLFNKNNLSMPQVSH